MAFVAPHPDVTQHTLGVCSYEDQPSAAYPAGCSPWVYVTSSTSPKESFKCMAKPPVTEKHFRTPLLKRNVVTKSDTFIYSLKASTFN